MADTVSRADGIIEELLRRNTQAVALQEHPGAPSVPPSPSASFWTTSAPRPETLTAEPTWTGEDILQAIASRCPCAAAGDPDNALPGPGYKLDFSADLLRRYEAFLAPHGDLFDMDTREVSSKFLYFVAALACALPHVSTP